MGFLKFCAIHFDEGVWSASASTSITLGLTGSGRAEKQQVPYRPVRRRHAHKKYLVEPADRVHGSFLPDDSREQERLDVPGGIAVTCSIQRLDRCFFERSGIARTGPAGQTKPFVLPYLILAYFRAGNRD